MCMLSPSGTHRKPASGVHEGFPSGVHVKSPNDVHVDSPNGVYHVELRLKRYTYTGGKLSRKLRPS